MKEILNRLIKYKTLNEVESKDILIKISNGELNNSQISSFLTVYMMRNITLQELKGFKDALIELCIKVDLKEFDTIDLCGTGGDGKDTFNISTLASFVTAGSGCKVAKHGNYGVSSGCGSSNVLESLGIKFTNDYDILKKLTLNPTIEDDFIDKNKTLYDYISEIVNSFKEISNKNFNIDKEQDSNSFEILKSVEIVYGLRNFIGNANKFSNENIYIAIKSDSQMTEITIEDDGPGIPKDILNKIGEPYIKTLKPKDNKKTGLGLGIFIGKTLLEKNSAKITIRNSETRGGAEVKIEWENKNLKKLV